MKFLKKLNKRVNKSKRKSLGICNNIFAGIITGGVFGSFIPNFFKENISFLGIFLTILFGGIFLIILYNIGKKFIAKDDIESKNYKNNFLAGTFASIYVTIMILIPSIYRFIILTPISVLFLIIVLYIYTKPKNKNNLHK
jgi:undecaprenyl pyrophosphate phosphatase UppP